MLNSSRSQKLPSLRLCLAAAFICWLAWLMFVVHLDNRSMWIDEHYTWRISRLGPVALIQDTAGDVHPPLYYLWVWAWMTWTGSEDLFMMRLTAAIPAVLAVALCYRLGRRWFNDNPWVGLGAALFLATSSIFVNYGRELRMYALIVFFILGNWWFLDRLFRGQKRGFVGYALTLALMAYTFYYAGFIIIAQTVTTALFYRKRLKQVFMAFGVALVLFLPWLPTFIRQLGTARSQSGDTTGAPIIGKFLGTKPTSFDAISEFVDMYSAGQAAFVALLVSLALTLTYGSNPRFRRWLVAVVLWFFLTITLFFALNLVIPIYGVRYVLIIAPALALLVGVAVYRLGQNRARLSMLALIGITGVLTHTHSFQVDRTPNRQLLRTVAARYLPGDRIWYDPPAGARGSYLWDATEYHLKFDAPQLSTDWFVWDAPKDYQDVAAVPRVWDVRPYWVPILEDARADLENGRTISEEFVVEGYTIHLYEAPPADQAPVRFGDTFEMIPGPLDYTTYHPGDTVVTKTWWRALQPPGQDYSYSLVLRRADGTVINQIDTGLAVGGVPTPLGLEPSSDARPTSLWSPDDPYALATPNVDLPADLPPGEYDIWIGVYFWQNPERLTVQEVEGQAVDSEQRLVRIGAIMVE